MVCLVGRQVQIGPSYQMQKVRFICSHPPPSPASPAPPYFPCLFLELTIKGGHLSPNTYPTAISMLEKQLLPMKVRTMSPRHAACNLKPIFLFC